MSKIFLLFFVFFSFSFSAVNAIHVMSSNAHNLYSKISDSDYLLSDTSTELFSNNFMSSSFSGYIDTSVALGGVSAGYPYYYHTYDSNNVNNDFITKTKDSLFMIFSSSIVGSNVTINLLSVCSNIHTGASYNITTSGYAGLGSVILDNSTGYNTLICKRISAGSFGSIVYDLTDFNSFSFDDLFIQLYKNGLIVLNDFYGHCVSDLDCSYKETFSSEVCASYSYPISDYYDFKDLSFFVEYEADCSALISSTVSIDSIDFRVNYLDIIYSIDDESCVRCVFKKNIDYLSAFDVCAIARLERERDCSFSNKVVSDFVCDAGSEGSYTASNVCVSKFLVSDIVLNSDGSVMVKGVLGSVVNGHIFDSAGVDTGLYLTRDGRVVSSDSSDAFISQVENSVDEKAAYVKDALVDDVDKQSFAYYYDVLSNVLEYIKDTYSYERTMAILKGYNQNDYNFSVRLEFRGIVYDLFSKNFFESYLSGFIDLFRNVLYVIASLAVSLHFLKRGY